MSTSCQSCSIQLSDNEDFICCDTCNSWYHYTCTHLDQNQFIAHCNNEHMPWKCHQCILNTHCYTCKIRPNPNQKIIHCNLCYNIFHLKCTGLNSAHHKNYLKQAKPGTVAHVVKILSLFTKLIIKLSQIVCKYKLKKSY